MSENLAGVRTDHADDVTARELRHARIEIVRLGDVQDGEVKTHVTGKLGSWTFRRLWYYWSASGGKMPMEKARELWNDPLGKDDVRVRGHCGCPSPDEYGAEYLDAQGLLLYKKIDGQNVDDWHGNGTEWRCVDDPKTEAASTFVRSYHVDSVAGLRLLADAIRETEGIK